MSLYAECLQDIIDKHTRDYEVKLIKIKNLCQRSLDGDDTFCSMSEGVGIHFEQEFARKILNIIKEE